MQLSIIALVICLFVFLFCLYGLSRDDFVLLRKNISLERLFNIAFVTVGAGLLFARIFYILFHYDARFMHPLVFLVFPYFPGLSLIGGILGGIVSIMYFGFYKNVAIGRIFDVLSLSVLFAIPFGELSIFIFGLFAKKLLYISLFTAIIYVIFAIFSLFLFQKAAFRDGSTGFLSIALSSFLLLFKNSIEGALRNILSPENIVLLIVGVISLVLFLWQEKLLKKLLAYWQK